MVRITENIALDDVSTSLQTGTVGEPSVAASRTGFFVTGNWYASCSTDAGRTWSFVDPFTTFSRARGDFCCDQLVLWEPNRKFWIWLLQYAETAGTNIFRVAVSRDASPGSWRTWEVSPGEVNASWRTWFDYPDMAVSDGHLFISFNQYTGDNWQRATVLRYSLDEVDAMTRGATSQLTRQHWATSQHGSLRFVVGADDTMWWASNDVSASALHVFAWPDSDPSVESWVVRVAPWGDDDYTAPGPANAAWLSRCDDRVTAGWRAPGPDGRPRLGWMWSSGRTATRPRPFIRAVVISEATLRVVSQPDVWSPTVAWAYPAAAASGRGRVGMTGFFGSPTEHPTHAVGILAADGSSWSTKRTVASTHSPLQGKWGDYLTVKPHPRRPTSLVASGFTLQGGQDRRNVEPRVVIFRP